MNKLLKYKSFIKTITLVVVFTLLSLSIINNLMEITSVSSIEDKVYVPIMMYHQIKYKDLGKDVISPDEFKSDLNYLKENNYNTITMSQLINYVYDGIDLPDNPIILSFDDGYLTTYKYVYPLLKEYDMKIVLSIVGKSTDDFTKVFDDNLNYAHLSWDQIQEMEQSGHVEIQNHTYNLHFVRNGRYGCYQKKNESLSEYESIITEDVNALQSRVRDITGFEPNTFTYPYGKYNDNTESIIKKLGFKATLSCTYGVNVIRVEDKDALFGLKRICRSHNQSIQKLIKGGMETLKYVE